VPSGKDTLSYFGTKFALAGTCRHGCPALGIAAELTTLKQRWATTTT
jgi:hypothetical protein